MDNKCKKKSKRVIRCQPLSKLVNAQDWDALVFSFRILVNGAPNIWMAWDNNSVFFR
jgi:hypothetical protein